MAGGRPTRDPKGSLLAVRLAERQFGVLQARAKREAISVSEAIRRCIDEWGSSPRLSPPNRSRPPTPEERKSFDEVFAAFGLSPSRRPRRRSRPR